MILCSPSPTTLAPEKITVGPPAHSPLVFWSSHTTKRSPSIWRNSVPGVMQFELNGSAFFGFANAASASDSGSGAPSLRAARRACCSISLGTR